MNCFLGFLREYDLLIQFAAVILTIIGLIFIFYAYIIAKRTLDIQQRQWDHYFSPLSFEFVFYDFSDPKDKSISIIFENKSPIPNRVSIINLILENKDNKASPDWTWIGVFSSKEEITINPSDRKMIVYHAKFSLKKITESSGANPFLVLDFSDVRGYDYNLEVPFKSHKGHFNVAYSSGGKSRKASSFLKFNGEIKATYSLTGL